MKLSMIMEAGRRRARLPAGAGGPVGPRSRKQKHDQEAKPEPPATNPDDEDDASLTTGEDELDLSLPAPDLDLALNSVSEIIRATPREQRADSLKNAIKMILKGVQQYTGLKFNITNKFRPMSEAVGHADLASLCYDIAKAIWHNSSDIGDEKAEKAEAQKLTHQAIKHLMKSTGAKFSWQGEKWQGENLVNKIYKYASKAIEKQGDAATKIVEFDFSKIPNQKLAKSVDSAYQTVMGLIAKELNGELHVRERGSVTKYIIIKDKPKRQVFPAYVPEANKIIQVTDTDEPGKYQIVSNGQILTHKQLIRAIESGKIKRLSGHGYLSTREDESVKIYVIIGDDGERTNDAIITIGDQVIETNMTEIEELIESGEFKK